MKVQPWFFLNFINNCVMPGIICLVIYVTGQVWLGIAIGAAVFLGSTFFIRQFFGDIAQFLTATEIALLHLKDGEFSLHLSPQKNTRLQHLTHLFHEVIEGLRQQRSSLLQRELLLRRVFETVSSALLLTDGREKIVLCNPAATQLLSQGKPIKGMPLATLLTELPASLTESITQQQDVLFTLDGNDGGPETWHLSCEHFHLNGQAHCLYHFKHMTRTLSRAEVDTWKKVIRVLSHELNNSLGPIASLSHSGKHIVGAKPSFDHDTQLLIEIFNTLAERAEHLKIFLGGYAHFARLPLPRPQVLEWKSFIGTLQNVVRFEWQEPVLLRSGFADATQLSQIIINLITNAQEAGATPDGIILQITPQAEWDKITLSDNGKGMNEEQLKQALLPFYSTKREGTGLGLALCREIVDAHGGRIKLANRKEGGLQVTLWLPAAKVGNNNQHVI